MKRFLKYIYNKHLHRQLDLRVRLFNILALAGILIGFVVGIANFVLHTGLTNTILAFLTGIISIFLLVYTTKTGRYQQGYLATIVIIFLGFFSALYFSGGGYDSSMPFYFIFAVVFTVFMIEGKIAFVMMALELAVYCGIMVYSHRHPEAVTALPSEMAKVSDLCVGLVIVCVALGVTLHYQFKHYIDQQKMLDNHNRMLKKSNQQKTEFLSNISHELKTPLTVVSSHLQMGQMEIAEYPELNHLQKTFSLVVSEVERMSMMISQVLDISRIDENRMQIEHKPDDIVTIIQSTLDTYYPVFAKNKNSLRFVCDNDIPSVDCDRIRIMQVLVNLIGNASRHTRAGEITITVTTAVSEAVVTVSDNGEGIAAELMPHLFERYTTKPPVAGNGEVRSELETGTGLGLFISKFIIEAHGGHIWIKSQRGKGTKVHFTVPFTLQRDTEPAKIDSHVQKSLSRNN